MEQGLRARGVLASQDFGLVSRWSFSAPTTAFLGVAMKCRDGGGEVHALQTSAICTGSGCRSRPDADRTVDTTRTGSRRTGDQYSSILSPSKLVSALRPTLGRSSTGYVSSTPCGGPQLVGDWVRPKLLP